MKETKIDWCDSTLNPVVGCKNGCPYCYARKLNKRFGFIKDWEKPQFFPERLKQLESKKPKSIFVDSMSDIEHWPYEAVSSTFNAIVRNPQHNYIFLSKALNQGYISTPLNQARSIKEGMNLKNVFFGKTVDKQSRFSEYENFDFISIEPILEPIDLSSWSNLLRRSVKLVIIGAETGNRIGKIIPKKEWIDDIVKVCDNLKISVFMKSSLREIMGNDFRQDKLIWEVNK